MWTDTAEVEASPGSLTRQPGIGWTAGAVSVQTIPAGDGYVRFSSQEANLNKMAGLGRDDADRNYTDIEYAYYLRDDGLVEIYEQGTSRGLVGAHTPGDMFQIEVYGQQVRYRKNGRVIHTSALAPAYPLALDTSLYHAGATIREAELVACVFADDPDCLPVEAWQNVYYAEASETWDLLRLERAPLSGVGWNAGASSVEKLEGDGFLCLYPEQTNRNVMAGLGRDDDSTSYTDIDYAFYLRNDGYLEIYEHGHSQGFLDTYLTSDELCLQVLGKQVLYTRNNAVIHTSLTPPTYPLAFDTSLYSPGAAISGFVLQCAPGDPMCSEGPWRNVRYTEATGDTLRRISGVGWNAGASSVEVIGAGDGYVSFTTEEKHLAKMAGLAHADDNQDYTDIDYAFYMRGDGWLEIFEHGSSRGVVGTYEPGDVLRVEVEGEQVRWRKNGVVLHTRVGAPDYPLALDTSLLQPGATITGAEVQSCAVGDLECMPDGVWRNVYYATADGDLLTRTPGYAWNAGASSQKTLTGDGYVLFGTHELGLAKMAGLDHSDDDRELHRHRLRVLPARRRPARDLREGPLAGPVRRLRRRRRVLRRGVGPPGPLPQELGAHPHQHDAGRIPARARRQPAAGRRDRRPSRRARLRTQRRRLHPAGDVEERPLRRGRQRHPDANADDRHGVERRGVLRRGDHHGRRLRAVLHRRGGPRQDGRPRPQRRRSELHRHRLRVLSAQRRPARDLRARRPSGLGRQLRGRRLVPRHARGRRRELLAQRRRGLHQRRPAAGSARPRHQPPRGRRDDHRGARPELRPVEASATRDRLARRGPGLTSR
ncbi:hypothetical protein [Nannocystis pusilla]|uniref:hypothetical protein n=1 Tax=Nannocystis pusilla TaxID=889268 RepID=UPI003DA3437D